MAGPIRDVSERGLAWMGLLDGGFHLKAVRSPRGPYVISSGLAFFSPGHIVRKSHRLEARAHATEMLRRHLALYCGTVHAYVGTKSQAEFDALVSYAYSVGERPFIESEVLWRIRCNDPKDVIGRAMEYTNPENRLRRRCEMYLYLNGIYKTP